MKLIGQIKIFVNGQLNIVDRNSIHDNLKAYFRDIMDSVDDQVIDSLFSTGGEEFGGTEDGNDGILAILGTASPEEGYTMETTTLSASNTHGKKWRGEYTNTSGGNQPITQFRIGHNFNATLDFATTYASYDPRDITLADQDTLVLEWELYIE